jgi:hypothetical protein
VCFEGFVRSHFVAVELVYDVCAWFLCHVFSPVAVAVLRRCFSVSSCLALVNFCF